MADDAEPSILSWYDARRPMIIDLVGDYAGKELFLVEGDSLLRESFEDDRIDFRGGFQMLHAAFVVERFLENLIKRHCNFHVAFFDDHRELCIPPGIEQKHRSRYLLARAVVIRHLMAHISESHPDVEVYIFRSLQSEEFEAYLHTSPIHFVMAHDGTLPYVGKVETEQDNDVQAKAFLRAIIWWFNNHRLNVALINAIEFRDSKVFTSIYDHSRVRGFVFYDVLDNSRNLVAKDEEKASLLARATLDVMWRAASEDSLATIGQSESLLLVACSVAIIIANDDCNLFLPSAFVLHILLKKQLTLSQRRLPLVEFSEEFETEIEEFLESFSELSSMILRQPEWSKAIDDREFDRDSVDLVDGRLFRSIVQALIEDTALEQISESVKEEFSAVSKFIFGLCGTKLSLDFDEDVKVVDDGLNDESYSRDIGEVAVMQFSNPVFDKHLECIHVDAEPALSSQFAAMKIYRETSHWHNHRKPLNPKQIVPEKVSKWKNPLRLNQFYMAEMTSYAASLTGSKGKVLEPETITVGVKKSKAIEDKSVVKTPPRVESPAPNAKKGGKKAGAGLSKAQQIIADNKEKKGGAESDKAFSAWTGVMKGFDEIASEQERFLTTKRYFDALDSVKLSHVEADINMYMLQSLLSWWAKYCKAEKKSEGYHVVALMFTLVHTTSAAPMTQEISQHIEKISTLVGITDAVSKVIAPALQDRKLSFAFKLPANSSNLKITLAQAEFQLLHCGPYMDRYLDAQPDARVSSFVPDGWQRKVLDELDADNSVFVVAPTSAGKTFISFYAMEKVLRENNDNVLVYVAPTKALVNQIAAEVQGRFSKKYPQAGKSVWAIHTRDYRVNNSTGCQILVTVPHVLQIMLLSPTNAKSWAPRVKRIIFDEIHSIGAAEDGVVWEQLLLLAPCPIIALSATIGNPEQFSDWLAETQKASNTKLTMIQHSTRYSDLRKYLYRPPQTFKFEGLGKSKGVGLGLDGLTGLTFFHPAASLVDKSRGMPDDLALEPRDCFLLWKVMCKHQTEKYKVSPALDPVKALPAYIKKANIFVWEKALKQVLIAWMADQDSPFDKVVQDLTPDVPTENYSAVPEGQVDPNDLKATTLPLLYQLHQRQALPAILFNYDRAGCEDIGFHLLGQLKAAEEQWKTGKEWQRKIEGWTKWKELKEKKSKKPVKPSKKKGGDDEDRGSKADQARDDASTEVSSYDFFDPDKPQDDFSFADDRKCQPSEVDGYIKQLRWKHIKEELLELLQRGIGIHHSGMNRKYRQCVEMLFRKGYLRVVIATGTLSLGINMPCATVVFSGDSTYLTALNFRQAAGRSGRRGFDLLGNVVFQGVTTERACRLLSSRLPDLTGHFPITTTLVLRLFSLLHDSKSSPYAIRAINSLLSQPRLYLGGESFKEQVLHHLRFSIEYLRRQSLLGPGGEPVNFTSCVSHLYFTENSSFAFHALLKDGYLATLCADIDTASDQVMRTLMVILSHIFGRIPAREPSDEKMVERIHRSPSNVYLEPMPAEAEAVLKKHNANTLAIFTTYVKTFAAQHVRTDEETLPLSGLTVSRQATPKSNGSANGHATPATNGVKDLTFLPSLPTPHARSPFVSLSGHGDDFTSIDDLCTSSRSHIFLESAVIPHIVIHPSESRAKLNAYLLDFFMHGSLAPLVDANGISRSEVWFKLNDFSLVLATIVASLGSYLGFGKAGRGEDEMLDVMGEGDAAENEHDEEEAAEKIAIAPTIGGTGAGAGPAVEGVKKGKKVADDWDADEDAMVRQERMVEETEVVMGGTDEEEYEKLLGVYRAMRRLKTEFDTKFRAIWA